MTKADQKRNRLHLLIYSDNKPYLRQNNLNPMLPNRIVLIEVLLVYHTRTTSPQWRPCYDRYPLTISDRVRYYRLAYVIQKYALSMILISFCVYHTNVPGYHNHLCTPVSCEHSQFWRIDTRVNLSMVYGMYIVVDRVYLRILFFFRDPLSTNRVSVNHSLPSLSCLNN